MTLLRLRFLLEQLAQKRKRLTSGDGPIRQALNRAIEAGLQPVTLPPFVDPQPSQPHGEQNDKNCC